MSEKETETERARKKEIGKERKRETERNEQTERWTDKKTDREKEKENYIVTFCYLLCPEYKRNGIFSATLYAFITPWLQVTPGDAVIIFTKNIMYISMRTALHAVCCSMVPTAFCHRKCS